MNKFLVVIWGNSDVTMSFVPLTTKLENQIIRDHNIAYDHAQGAELSIPAMMVEECNEHIDNFDKLKNGDIIEVTDDLRQLLLDLIPEKVCGGL